RRPTPSTATTVWVRLWESVPTMTMPKRLLAEQNGSPQPRGGGHASIEHHGRLLSSHAPRGLGARQGRPSGTSHPTARQRRNERTPPGATQDGIDTKKVVAAFRIALSSSSRRTFAL